MSSCLFLLAALHLLHVDVQILIELKGLKMPPRLQQDQAGVFHRKNDQKVLSVKAAVEAGAGV